MFYKTVWRFLVPVHISGMEWYVGQCSECSPECILRWSMKIIF